jgi:hypothetical protein
MIATVEDQAPSPFRPIYFRSNGEAATALVSNSPTKGESSIRTKKIRALGQRFP